MTERENFLERWSRKKREAVDESEPEKRIDVETDGKPTVAAPADAEVDKLFDLEDLPSLESITADTDIRDFLRPGVPADLKREALRRAWSTDPGIRDFIGLAENSGDFNDPTAMAGFGPIDPSEVARLMAQFVLTPSEEKKVAHTPEQLTDQVDGEGEAVSSSDSSEAAPRTAEVKDNAVADAAPQNDDSEPRSVGAPRSPTS